MAEIDTYPPGYHQYLATQRRVSNWVKQTHSQTHLRGTGRKTGAKRRSPGAESALANSSLPRHQPSAQRTSGTLNLQKIGLIEQAPISPAIALISSSLFVYAFLPSLLVIAAFVVILTLATMETEELQDRASKAPESASSSSL